MGLPTGILLTDYLLRGVAVPAGNHESDEVRAISEDWRNHFRSYTWHLRRDDALLSP
jgi:hypothetical protein